MCSLKEFAMAIDKGNPIFMLGLSYEIKKSGFNTVKDMIQHNLVNLTNIQGLLNQIPIQIRQKIVNPNLEKDETVMRIGKTNLAIKLNIFREIRSIKHRELYLGCTEETCIESNPFIRARKILHPKERMAQYMDLHSKTYTAEKLARLGMIDDNSCKICKDKVETRDHLYIECERAKMAWEIYNNITKTQISELEILEGPLVIENLNIFSLVKHNLLCARDKPINPTLLNIKCENRQVDEKLCRRNIGKATWIRKDIKENLDQFRDKLTILMNKK